MSDQNSVKYPFETGVYRPPSEGGSDSLLVRFTRNCPWNHCTFCGMYKSEKFELRALDEIKNDLDAISRLCSDLLGLRRQSKTSSSALHDAAIMLMRRNPELEYHHGFPMVYHWLLSGGKTAFLQDANSLIMKTEPLTEALTYLRRTFPTIERVTSYARSKTLAKKKPDTLKKIQRSGLDRVHIGLESGDAEVLRMIRKGAAPEDHIKGGKKAMAAGFQVSEYWMPGVGGKHLWQQHAINTARVLNEINPHYIRSRPFRSWPGTPQAAAISRNEIEPLSAREQLREIRLTVENLNVTGKVCFDHAGNHWKNRRGALVFSHSYEGYQFPEEKARLLALIDEGL